VGESILALLLGALCGSLGFLRDADRLFGALIALLQRLGDRTEDELPHHRQGEEEDDQRPKESTPRGRVERIETTVTSGKEHRKARNRSHRVA
jgi:hypothetical protein